MTPQPDSHATGSRSDDASRDVRERADQLQRKVSDLSKTLGEIEKTLEEAAGEKEE